MDELTVTPGSLKRPAMNNQEYKKYLDGTWHNFHNFHAEVIDTIEDRGKNKVVIHARSTADTAVGKYANEYMLVFHLTGAGDKVVRFQEFVDSGATVEFFSRLRKHIAENP
jgi:ketosteroid isomerase-like protein